MMYTVGNINNDGNAGLQGTLHAASGMRAIWPFALLGDTGTHKGITDARKLAEELTADIAALKGKIVLMKSRLVKEQVKRDVPEAEEAPAEGAAPSKALGMVHHLKHTKNSIRPV